MSRTPGTPGSGPGPGPGNPGSVPPKRPAAYPAPKTAAASAATPSSAAPTAHAATPAASHARPGAAPAPAPVSGNSKTITGPGAKPDYFSKRNLVLGGSALGVLVVLIGLMVWRPWQPEPPRLNEQPYKIAQFAATSAMDRLPWSQQREYMDILDAKDDALLIAYKEGKLSDQEYRRSLQLGWYDKHLDRMEKFFSRPPPLRIRYLDEKVLGKKYKNLVEAAQSGEKDKDGKPKKKDESDDASPLLAEEIDRDDSNEERDIKKWPADVRQMWTEYRAELSKRKDYFKELERQEKEKRKAAEANAAGGKGTNNGTGATATTTNEAGKAAGGQ